METVPLGNLKQYLEARAREAYYNVASSQIIEGVEAVHQLDVRRLYFTCS